MPSAIGSDLDLDLFGILGVAGRERRAAPRAHDAGLRATRGDPRPRASGCSLAVSDRADPSAGPACVAWKESRSVTLAFKVIRAIPGRRFFALATEELILELSVLTAKIFNLGFEVLGPMHGPSVLSFPIPDLLPQFVVLTPQFGNFLAQLKNFVTKLPHQFEQISRLARRKWFDERVFHDTDFCNPELT